METKPWYQSKTIIGATVTVAASIAALFGLNIGADEQAAIVDASLAIAGGIGGLIAIYGRIKADMPIGK